MATITAEAKLYTGIRCWCVDKNISAALTSSFSIGNYNRPIQPANEFVLSSGALVQRLKRTVADVECVAGITLTDERYKTYGGGNNVITAGSPRVINNTNNWKLISSVICDFPTYIEIDVEKLQLPEGTDVILNFEEGWVLEDRGRQLPSGAWEYPTAIQGSPSPKQDNFISFRTPWYGLSFMNSSFSLPNRTALRIKQLASSVSSTASITALPIFNPGKLAALFGGVFITTPNASKTVRTGATLFNSFGPLNVGGTPILATITKIKQLASDITSGAFNVSLPEFDVVIEMSSNLVSQFTKTISSANSRIRYLINQSLTSNVQLISNSANSRIRFVSPTLTAVSSMSASLTMGVTQTLVIEEPSQSQFGERFGEQIAIDGNNIIISNPGLPAPSGGTAYIYNATTGALIRTLNNPNPVGTINNDSFGISVDIAGNYAVVGAHQEDGPNSSFKGRAYLFNVSTGALIESQTNLNNVNDYYFGLSVATDGANFAVGQNVDGFRIYPITDSWSYNIPAPQTNDRFYTVDIQGSNLVVGVRRLTVNFTDTYAVYHYSFSNGSSTLVRTLNNPNPFFTQQDDYFGNALSVFGNNVLVGAYGEETSGLGNVGKAYLFSLTTGNLVHTFNNPSPNDFDQFGKSVALNNRYAIISDKNQFHIFNILDGSLERSIAVPNANDVSISGNTIVVSGSDQFTSTIKRVFVFRF